MPPFAVIISVRAALIVLLIAWLGACDSGASNLPHGADRPLSPPPGCSTNPDHGANGWIDPTRGKRAGEIFKDPRTAALAAAVMRNDTAEITALLTEGIDVNIRGEGGVTLLDWALRREKPESFNLLLQAGADPASPGLATRSAVHDAAIADDTSYMSMLVARHANLNVTTHDGETPLVLALVSGCDKQFHMLIAAGADVNVSDAVGNTSLHTAAMINQFGDALELLQAGANPLARNRTGITFQRYLHMTPESVLSAQGKAGIAKIHQWLNAHHIPVEARPHEEVMPQNRHN